MLCDFVESCSPSGRKRRVDPATGTHGNGVRPEKQLSGKPQWDTMVFRIPAKLLNPDRVGQTIGVGGGDRQVWIASIRCGQP